MSPELHLPVFLASLVAMQGMLTLWSLRAGASPPTALLVALLPVVGLPYQLYSRFGRKKRAQPSPHQWVVIRDQDANRLQSIHHSVSPTMVATLSRHPRSP